MGRPLIREAPAPVNHAMRTSLIALAIPAALASGPAFAADTPATGTWTVHGKVSAFQFNLSCRFEQKGEAVGGICYDAGTNKPHTLTQGAISGDHISWTYQSSYLLKTFDAAYSGTLAGGSIKGDITVPGYQGQFTAERQP